MFGRMAVSESARNDLYNGLRELLVQIVRRL
jgi:hypothetical protein